MKKILILVIICSLVKVEAQTSTFARIDSLVQFGRYKTALNLLEELPPSFASNQKTASIYEAIDDHKTASKYYEKALQYQPDELTKIKLAKSYQKQKKYKKAIVIFEEVSQKDDANLLVKYQLGKLYLRTKQANKAKTAFEFLIEKDPTNANYSYQLGLVYTLLKKRNEKLNSFIDAFEKDSTHIKAIEKLAKGFVRLDRDSSKLFIKKGLEIAPNNIPLNRLKINDLFRAKQYEDALVVLQKIDTLQPMELYNKKMIGRTLYNLKRYDEAIPYFELASKLDREDFKSLTYLGHIYAKKEEYRTALFSYMQATYRGKKDRDEEFMGLAQVFYNQKEPKKAIENFKNAIRENHKNYEALYQLATLSDDYYKDKKIAYKLYKRYIDRFEEKDKVKTAFVQNRITAIKKIYFLKGEELE